MRQFLVGENFHDPLCQSTEVIGRFTFCDCRFIDLLRPVRIVKCINDAFCKFVVIRSLGAFAEGFVRRFFCEIRIDQHFGNRFAQIQKILNFDTLSLGSDNDLLGTLGITHVRCCFR